ncbi:MAG: hypothetical protein EBR09_14355 [Proteobacteria bacterium]|nr:hypothetical protein [Pseudomonadota bacterium]
MRRRKSKTHPQNHNVWIRVIVLCIFSICAPAKSLASEGDFSIVQRGGTSINKGNLSRDSRYPTYSLGFMHSFYTNLGKSGLELSNLITLSHSTFYTLKTPDMKFPVLAKAPYQLFEPAFLYNACLFVYTRFRPCVAGGMSAIYLRHDAQNYKMYSAFPLQVRLQLVGPSGIFVEGGASYRKFSARRSGELSWSQDLTAFFGLGVLFMSQF